MTQPVFTDPNQILWVVPDLEVVFGEYLKGRLGDDATVYTALPATVSYVKPVLRINRIGGIRRSRIMEEGVMDVDVWHGNATSCKAMMARARAHLLGARGVMHRGVVVTQTWEVAGPGRRPEEDPAMTRIGFTVGLLVHPA